MIPRIKTQEEIRAAFELMLKDHGHIANLSNLEAREFYQLAAKEYRSIVKQSKDLEGYDHLQRAMEKSDFIKDALDGMFNDVAYEASMRMMQENRSGFVLKIADGVYVSGLTEVIQFCETYNMTLPPGLLETWNYVFALVRNLEEVIQMLEARWKMPIVRQKVLKPKTRKIETLKAASKGPRHYEAARRWLIDQNLCDPITMVWRDKKKGNMSVFVLTIKDLIRKGYLEDLRNSEIVAIAQNSFNFKVGIDIVKTPKDKHYHQPPYFAE